MNTHKHNKTPQLSPDWSTGIYTGDTIITEQLAAVDQAKKLRTHEERLAALADLVTTDGDYTKIHIRSEQDMQRLWDQYGTDIYHTGDHNIVIVDHVGQW